MSNSGEGALNFDVAANVPWLTVSPINAVSLGPEQRVSATYNTAALGVGDYDALIRVTSTNAANSPQFVALKLHVIPPACFWEPFDFYDGNLTLMGAANWNGTATNQIMLEANILKILGGAGLVSASHFVNCAGSNGFIGAQIKIRKGNGSGDFFWNIAVDDPSGNNLARWYGGSTIARGRVGNNITADMLLTGSDSWDDLYVRIDSFANTSEFFFNGVSFGPISHGTAPANSIGSIRIERLDRNSAANDSIQFDNLTVGALDTMPPRINVTRSGSNLLLSWAATGVGATLECTSILVPQPQWLSVTDSLSFANGQNTFTAAFTGGATFYRLRKH